jgi:CheY-like chemotaxis protein
LLRYHVIEEDPRRQKEGDVPQKSKLRQKEKEESFLSHQQQQEQSIPLPPPKPVQKTFRIMTVDDEPDIVAVYRIGLKRAGFEVDGHTDPRKALREYKPGKYDLVILDIKMPGLTGYELYGELKRWEEQEGHANSPKVIFVTAYDAQREVLKLFPELPDDCIMVKPVEIRNLVRAIHRLVADT